MKCPIFPHFTTLYNICNINEKKLLRMKLKGSYLLNSLLMFFIIKSNRFILYIITEENRWLDRHFVNNNSQMANLLLEFVSLFY